MPTISALQNKSNPTINTARVVLNNPAGTATKVVTLATLQAYLTS